MPSFDIVSKIDMPSVQNALDGVKKEINTRYDFKGSVCEVELQDDKIILKADDELKRRQVEELILTHLTRKKVDAGALEFEKPEAATGNSIRQSVLIKQGVDLAKLSQNLLKGEDLTSFIKRSVELIK